MSRAGEWDVVVAGAGHNSLLTAAYAARAGFKVLVLEGAPRIGGDTTCEELTLPGFIHDPCATAHNLIQTNPEKALPILLKLLEGNASPKIKEKALFVLSQSGSDKSREIVANFARGKSNPDLQLKSLEYLALFGGKESRQVLADVYASATETKIKSCQQQRAGIPPRAEAKHRPAAARPQSRPHFPD